MEDFQKNNFKNCNNSNRSFDLPHRKRKKTSINPQGCVNFKMIPKLFFENQQYNQQSKRMKRRRSATMSNLNINNTSYEIISIFNKRSPKKRSYQRNRLINAMDSEIYMSRKYGNKSRGEEIMKKYQCSLKKKEDINDILFIEPKKGVSPSYESQGELSNFINENTIHGRKLSIKGYRPGKESKEGKHHFSPRRTRVKSERNDKRFDNFFDYIEKCSHLKIHKEEDNEKSEELEVISNEFNVKIYDSDVEQNSCDKVPLNEGPKSSDEDEKKKDLNKMEAYNGILEYKFVENIKCHNMKIGRQISDERTTPTVEEIEIQKEDLKYDDQYLYGSQIEVPTKQLLNVHSPLFPKSKTEDLLEDCTLSDHPKSYDPEQVIVDESNDSSELRPRRKFKQKDTNYREQEESFVKDSILKFSEIKEFDDEFYTSRKGLDGIINFSAINEVSNIRLCRVGDCNELDEHELIDRAFIREEGKNFRGHNDRGYTQNVQVTCGDNEQLIDLEEEGDAAPAITDKENSVVKCYIDRILGEKGSLSKNERHVSFIMTEEDRLEMMVSRIFEELVTENQISIKEFNKLLCRELLKRQQVSNDQRTTTTINVDNKDTIDERIPSLNEAKNFVENDVSAVHMGKMRMNWQNLQTVGLEGDRLSGGSGALPFMVDKSNKNRGTMNRIELTMSSDAKVLMVQRVEDPTLDEKIHQNELIEALSKPQLFGKDSGDQIDLNKRAFNEIFPENLDYVGLDKTSLHCSSAHKESGESITNQDSLDNHKALSAGKLTMTTKAALTPYFHTVKSSEKLDKTLRKVTVRSRYSLKGNDKSKIPTKICGSYIRPSLNNSKLYRSNELLLQPAKPLRVLSTSKKPSDMDEKVIKKSYWSLPYGSKSRSLPKEIDAQNLMYNINCANCHRKTIQNLLSSVVQSPGQPLKSVFEKPSRSHAPSSSFDSSSSEMHISTSNTRRYNLIDEGFRDKKNVPSFTMIKATELEIQNSFTELCQEKKDGDNLSIYLEIDEREKPLMDIMDSVNMTSHLLLDDQRLDPVTCNQIVCIVPQSPSINDSRKKIDDQNNFIITELNDTELASKFKGEAYVHDSEIVLSHKVANPSIRRRYQFVNYKSPIVRNIKNSLNLGKVKDPTNKVVEARSLKQKVEYYDIVDINNLIPETNTVHPSLEKFGRISQKINPVDRGNQSAKRKGYSSSISQSVQIGKGSKMITKGTQFELMEEYFDGLKASPHQSSKFDNEISCPKPSSKENKLEALKLETRKHLLSIGVEKGILSEPQESQSKASEKRRHSKTQEEYFETSIDKQILKESSNALNLKRPENIDPNDLLISSFDGQTVLGMQKVENSQENTGSENRKGPVKCDNPFYLPSIDENNEAAHTLLSHNVSNSFRFHDEEGTPAVNVPHSLPKDYETDSSDSLNDNSLVVFRDDIEMLICHWAVDYLLGDAVNLLAADCRYLPDSSDNLDEHLDEHLDDPIDEPSWKRSLANSPSWPCHSDLVCCYFCQCQIDYDLYDEHIKLCTQRQKKLIVRSKSVSEVRGRNPSSRPSMSTSSGTLCFLCGCYFTRHSIFIHEVACRDKWIKVNERLPLELRRPVPEKPYFSEEIIREQYEREKHRGNSKFRVGDAINKLIYEASLKYH